MALLRLQRPSRLSWITEGYQGKLERNMERLAKEYIDLLSGSGNASDHFWELEKRIKLDKKNPGVQIEMRKSETIWDITAFVGRRIITMDELDGFSAELIDAVRLILSR